MIMELLQKQIPQYWKIIKLACVKSDEIKDALQEKYCENLLIDLLSGKKHCVLKVNIEKELVCVYVFEIKYNELRDAKYMHITNVFGLKKQEESDWYNAKEDFKVLCRKYECKSMITNASNEYVKELLEKFGCKIQSYVMHYFLED